MLNTYMSFRVSGLLFGVSAEQVIEVSRSAELTRLPQSADHVLGLINLRGALAVGIDLVRCLNSDTTVMKYPYESESGLWVFAQTSQGLLGLRVQEVCHMHVVAQDDLEPAPVSLKGPLGRMVEATVPLPGCLLHILALNEIPLHSDTCITL